MSDEIKSAELDLSAMRRRAEAAERHGTELRRLHAIDMDAKARDVETLQKEIAKLTRQRDDARQQISDITAPLHQFTQTCGKFDGTDAGKDVAEVAIRYANEYKAEAADLLTRLVDAQAQRDHEKRRGEQKQHLLDSARNTAAMQEERAERFREQRDDALDAVGNRTRQIDEISQKWDASLKEITALKTILRAYGHDTTGRNPITSAADAAPKAPGTGQIDTEKQAQMDNLQELCRETIARHREERTKWAQKADEMQEDLDCAKNTLVKLGCIPMKNGWIIPSRDGDTGKQRLQNENELLRRLNNDATRLASAAALENAALRSIIGDCPLFNLNHTMSDERNWTARASAYMRDLHQDFIKDAKTPPAAS